MSTIKYILSLTFLNLLLFHVPFYSYVLEHIEVGTADGLLSLFVVMVALFVVNIFLLSLLALISTKVLKGFTLFMLFSAPIALYFMSTYNTILDRTMMGNLFNTNTSEALSYYHPKMFIYLFIGLLLAYIVFKIPIKKSKRVKLLKFGLGITVMGIVILYINSSKWLWLDKHAKNLGARAMPWSYVINSIRYKLRELKEHKKQILLPTATFANPKEKIVVILVIGESARAKSFSLYGYERETNPRLKKEDIVVLKNTKATATYTTASVHSMLSYVGSSSDSYEPLPNYLQRQGVEVIWRTKNWGEPHLNVETYQRASDLEVSCKGDECNYDSVLLTGLMKRIKASKKKKVFVVLHTSGSHGPSYFEKYPKKFELFKPVCKTVNIKECSQEELNNAYDNTIVYTDYFLATIIEKLKKEQGLNSLMIYLSDHGESLGEYGLYLHGTPYSIAPDVQKKVPFLFWASNSFKEKRNLKNIDFEHQKEHGDYNIFHSVMGAFEMNSTIYDNKLDIFSYTQ